MASAHLTQSRTQPSRHVRRHRQYLEADTDTDTDEEQNQSRPSNRPPRASRTVNSYREHSDTDTSGEVIEDETSDSATSPAAEAQADSPRRHVPARQTRSHKRTRSGQSTSNRRPFASFKRKKFGKPLPHHNKLGSSSRGIYFPVREQSPPWQTLEYQIWVKILQYAACPIYDQSGRCNASAGWLLEMSRLCKTLHESAIAVLTWAPPLHPSYRAHGLLDLLSGDQTKLTLDYTTKIHALDIEAKQLLIRKSGIELRSLIEKTPLLKHLRIFHLHDDFMGKFIWAKPEFGRDKWAYGELFELLDQNNIKLQSFEWNGRFRDTSEAIVTSSIMSCMSLIQDVRLVNFSFEERHEVHRRNVRDLCLTALATYPLGLKKLELINCNIVDTEFMQCLPMNLSDLVITNCQALVSDALQEYLHTHGRSIIKLHLIGNQVMDLGFTPKLKDLCPDLRDLLIDLTYEDSSSYCDRDPLYDNLLPSGRPTWPSQLQTLVIGPLRSLSVADAEDFYQSLIDAAEEMPYLRNLSIKTLLKDASWRDRAQLRSKWAAIMEHVFLINTQSVGPSSAVERGGTPRQPEDSTRKSTRIQELEDVRSSECARKVQPEIGIDFDSLPRHNRCERVQFELSDQRPAQEQYREEDFLDDELSGDEEWNGN